MTGNSGRFSRKLSQRSGKTKKNGEAQNQQRSGMAKKTRTVTVGQKNAGNVASKGWVFVRKENNVGVDGAVSGRFQAGGEREQRFQAGG